MFCVWFVIAPQAWGDDARLSTNTATQITKTFRATHEPDVFWFSFFDISCSNLVKNINNFSFVRVVNPALQVAESDSLTGDSTFMAKKTSILFFAFCNSAPESFAPHRIVL